MKTLGQKISDLRKRSNMTQEDLAQKLGISSQAVSKWENDLSIPDVPLIIEMSDMFGVSLDELLKDREPTTQLVAEGMKKPVDKMILRIIVNTVDGDKVKLNLPMALVKVGLEIGMNGSNINMGNFDLSSIDFDQILYLASEGVVGKLLEVESSDGDIIEIFVE